MPNEISYLDLFSIQEFVEKENATMTAKFRDGREAVYTSAVLLPMSDDPDVRYAVDNETGVILWSRD